MLYLGPFAKCKRTYVTVQVEIVMCPNCHIKKERSSWSYCPACGACFATTETEQLEETICAFDLAEQIDQALFHCYLNDNVTCYFPNRNRGQEREFILDDVTYQQIGNVVISDEYKWFSLKFKHEITMLRQKYEAVEITWGIVRILT